MRHPAITTNPAAAAPSNILPTHPQLWFHAAQPPGVRWKRHTTARPLTRADTRPYFTATTIIDALLSAALRPGMLRDLFRLLAPPSDHTTYDHRTRPPVINDCHQGVNVLTVSLPPTPSEIMRKIRPEQPEEPEEPCGLR
jgi:hypothetical protein